MNAVRQVAAWKEQHGLPVLDASREQEVLQRNREHLQDAAYGPQLEALYQMILSQSREFQKQMISTGVVAYAGVEGAFSHMVCEKLYPDHPKLNCPSFEEVFAAVRDARAELGSSPGKHQLRSGGGSHGPADAGRCLHHPGGGPAH